MKLINKEIQEAYCNDEILQLLYDKEMRFYEVVVQGFVWNSLAEQRFNEGDVSYLKDSVTHQIVVEWLYSNFGIWIYIRPVLDEDGEWIFKGYIKLMNNFKAKEFQTKVCRKPQEAYQAAIKYTLENLIK